MNRKTGILLAALLLTSPAAFAMDTVPSDQNQNQEPVAAAVRQNGKWGVVNGAGKAVVPIIYDKAALSLSPDELVKADLSSMDNRDNLIEVKSGSLRGFYDRSGKEVVPVSYTSRSYWQDGYVTVKNKQGKMGAYREDGKEIAPVSYDSLSMASDGMVSYKEGSKYGFLGENGEKLDAVYENAGTFTDGAAPVEKDGKWGAIDKSGNTIVPFAYQEAASHFSEGLLAVKKNGKWGFVDKTGKEVVVPEYKMVIPEFSEGLTAVETRDKKWGFIKTDGTVAIEPQYKAVYTPFSEDLAGVSTSDGKGYIHKDGTVAFMADYDGIYTFHDGIAEYRVGKVRTVVRNSSPVPISIGIGIGWGGHHHHHHGHWYPGWGWGPGIGIGFPYIYDDPWFYDGWGEPVETVTVQSRRGYIDNTGRIIASAENDHVYPMNEYGSLVMNKNRYGFVNRKGLFVAHIVYRNMIPDYDAEALIAKNEDKEWGALSISDGHEVIPFTYDEIKAGGNKCFIYKENGEYGLMDKDGKKLTEALYSSIGQGEDNRFAAEKNGEKLYLDSDGKEVITWPEGVDKISAFHDGVAAVKKNGKWGMIDTEGNWLIKPLYEEMDIL